MSRRCSHSRLQGHGRPPLPGREEGGGHSNGQPARFASSGSARTGSCTRCLPENMTGCRAGNGRAVFSRSDRSLRHYEAVRGGIQRPPLVLPHPADPVFPVSNRAAMAAQRAPHRIFLFFCGTAALRAYLFPPAGFFKPSFLRFFLMHQPRRHPLQGQTFPGTCSSCRDTPGPYIPRQPEDLTALTDRAQQHGRDFLKQLYMSILYKN